MNLTIVINKTMYEQCLLSFSSIFHEPISSNNFLKWPSPLTSMLNLAKMAFKTIIFFSLFTSVTHVFFDAHVFI